MSIHSIAKDSTICSWSVVGKSWQEQMACHNGTWGDASSKILSQAQMPWMVRRRTLMKLISRPQQIFQWPSDPSSWTTPLNAHPVLPHHLIVSEPFQPGLVNDRSSDCCFLSPRWAGLATLYFLSSIIKEGLRCHLMDLTKSLCLISYRAGLLAM